MTAKELDLVRWRVTEEGSDYTFRHYSHWEEIKDEEFHALRKNYLDAAKSLVEYLNFDD